MTNANAITLAPDREPWARQPKESEKQYLAFQAFLALDPPRTVQKLAQTSDKGSASHLYQWSSRNHWVQRTEHYDGWLQRRHMDELHEQRVEMNKRHAQLAKAMSAKVAARIQTLQPDELSPGELGRWMSILSMVERLALGEGGLAPQTDVTVNVGVQVNNEPEVFNPDRLAEVLERLQASGVLPEPTTVVEVGDALADDTRTDGSEDLG